MVVYWVFFLDEAKYVGTYSGRAWKEMETV